jgi:hypothetical protein
VSALIFTCNVVVFLLIVIVLQLLRGCLHHGPQSCSMFRWPFLMVIVLENANCKTFGSFHEV